MNKIGLSSDEIKAMVKQSLDAAFLSPERGKEIVDENLSDPVRLEDMAVVSIAITGELATRLADQLSLTIADVITSNNQRLLSDIQALLD